MSTSLHIRYWKRQEIDIASWDACIQQSANRLLYGFHYYLDELTGGQWDALVLGDYQAGMPLTWRRKYGISYLAQPPFSQQKGIFSPLPVPGSLLLPLLQAARRHFPFSQVFLHH